MNVSDKKVVTISYTLKDAEGEILDTSEGDEPLAYIHGEGNIVPGLEKALAGKAIGDEIAAVVPPEEGYGTHEPGLVQRVPVRKLPTKKPEVGMQFQAETEDGPRVLTVIGLEGDYATLDANHPLAGATLHFNVKILGVRDATAEELEHGHVHTPGSHHH